MSTDEKTTPKRVILYSSSRRGYMRGTIEDGTRAELDAMNAEARGTPFFDGAVDKKKPPAPDSPSVALADRLARLSRKP